MSDDAELIAVEAELLLQNGSRFEVKEADLLRMLERPAYRPGLEAPGVVAADEYEDYGDYDDEFA